MGTAITKLNPRISAATDNDAERFVLSGRPLREGVRLPDTSRFGDTRWELTPAVLQQQAKPLVLDFAVVPEPFQKPVKELFYLMLSGPLPAGEVRLSVLSVRRLMVDVKRFVVWTATHTAAQSFSDLTIDNLAKYACYLSVTVTSPASREVAEVAARLLWRYRSGLQGNHLRFDPLDAEGWGRSTRRRLGSENATPRIPEPVMGTLLAWSLRFVDVFAPDVLAACDLWDRKDLRGPARSSDPSRTARKLVTAPLQRFLSEHLASGTPLPGHRGRIDFNEVARRAEVSRRSMSEPYHRRKVLEVADTVGVDDHVDLGVRVTGTIAGRPWLPKIAKDWQHRYGTATLAGMLQAACYITIAYLSGMRDSEIKHLQRGCVRVHRDASGTAYRWTIRSRAFKGESDPAGAPATWVIGEAAARAVDVLERLQHSEADMLFAPLKQRSQSRIRALAGRETNDLLNAFISWINAYAEEYGLHDPVPNVDGTVWRLSTRQFRRTLAWYLARQPGGSIAGAIQYRHLGVQMFEGYAGTSESGFRAEVEAELALARGEHLLAMTTAHDHPSFTGPAAAEASRRLAELGHRARYAGQVITDSRQLKRVMQLHDPQIYPGQYVTCVFNPDKALCHPTPDSRGRLTPTPRSCQPLDCRNVALTATDVNALRAERAQLDAQMNRRPALPPLLQHRLNARRTKIAEFLDRNAGDHDL